MQTGKIETSHGTIAYRDSGGAGPVVFLIHGNSSSSRIFEKQFASDLANRFRLIAPDLPGHGDSSKAPDPQSTYYFAGYAAALMELMEKMGVTAAHIAGWSLGGHIALEILARWPGAQSAFIFGTPPLPLDVERAITAFLPSEHMALTFAECFTEEQARMFIEPMIAPPLKAEPWMIEDAIRCDGRTRAVGYEAAVAGRNLDEEVIVRETTKPLAVLHGELDAFISLDFIKTIEMPTLWHGEIYIFRGIGHTPQWEAAEEFNGLLAAFVAEAEAGANPQG